MMLPTCAACGQPVASTARFCAVCGWPVQPVQRTCPQCSGQISAQEQFCSRTRPPAASGAQPGGSSQNGKYPVLLTPPLVDLKQPPAAPS